MKNFEQLPPWSEEIPLNDAAQPGNVINVSWPERMLSAVGGTLLVSSGIRNLTSNPLGSLVKTILGGCLLYRAASGNSALYTAIGKTKGVVHTEAINVRTSLIVNKSRFEVYQFWRKLENLPLFMHHLSSVQEIDEIHSRWEAIIPGNLGRIRWNAEIVKEEYGSFLGWHSINGSAIENAGKVEFLDTPDDGTELRVVITYRPPAGDLGVGIAKILNPVFEKIIIRDIQQFKDYIEGNAYTDTKKWI